MPSVSMKPADTTADVTRCGLASVPTFTAPGVRTDALERLIALAELEELGRIHPELAETQRRELAVDVHELVGPGIRQRPEDHPVDHAEDGGVRADAEREGEDRDA